MKIDAALRRILAARAAYPDATIAQVAAMAHVSERTAYRRITAARSEDIAITTSLDARDERDRRSVARMRDAGLSVSRISMQTGMSRRRVARLLGGQSDHA